MFGTVLTVTYTLLLLYFLWRAASVPWITRCLSRKSIAGLGLVFWTIFFLARYIGHSGTGPMAVALELAGMILFGSVFLTATVLFLVDLGTVFGFAFKRWAPMLRGWGIVAGIMLSGIAFIQGNRAPAVVSYEVTFPSLPAKLDGTVLVAASEAHLGARTGERWFMKRVEQIRALKPDVLVFLGDMFEGHGDGPRDIPALRDLSVPLGKWFVLGNHESHQPAGADTNVLERSGFRLLANQWAEPAPGLILAGVNDLTRYRRQGLNEDPLGRALANRPKGATVLLSHSPLQADRAARAGVGLMLSGHTHGGQIWPFGYLVQRAYPFFVGRYDVDGMTMIVSRGMGSWGPPMRLWKRNEILKITLYAPQHSTGENR